MSAFWVQICVGLFVGAMASGIKIWLMDRYFLTGVAWKSALAFFARGIIDVLVLFFIYQFYHAWLPLLACGVALVSDQLFFVYQYGLKGKRGD